jgi:hypothetical protein
LFLLPERLCEADERQDSHDDDDEADNVDDRIHFEIAFSVDADVTSTAGKTIRSGTLRKIWAVSSKPLF